MRGLRWWQTISMSRCSSTVLTVCGRVGLVEDGSTFGCRGDRDDVRRMAAAGALGVVGVDRRGRRSPRASTAGSRPRSSVSVWIATCTPVSSADAQAGVDRRRRRAPVLVQLEAARARRAPARAAPRGETVLPLPSSSTLTGSSSSAQQHLADRPRATACRSSPACPRRARCRRRSASSSRPRRASSTICGQMKCTWQSIPPAVRMRPSPAMISVVGADLAAPGATPSIDVRVAGLAERRRSARRGCRRRT